MAYHEAPWKPDPPIDAKRAPVAPRVCLHPGQASLPIDQHVRKLLDKRVVGKVCLAGESGSGKSTALAHLAAVFGAAVLGTAAFGDAALEDEAKITLVDRPLAGDHPAMPPGGLIVYTSPVVADPGRVLLLKMSPWGTEDLIEYLLATHPGRCRGVMERIKLDPVGVASLRGLPELWRIALDEMAADEGVKDVESALLRHLSRSLLTPIDWEVAGRKCLTVLAPWGKIWMAGPSCDPLVSRLIRHPTVSMLLAARELARGLADGTVDAELRGALPGDLIGSCGRILPQFPLALERLKDLVSGEDREVHAMAASLLHAAGDPWRPFERRFMNLSRARLSGAQWPGVELPESRMASADLAGALLDESDLAGVGLERARLARASLRKANLNSARFAGANLRCADLGWALANDARFIDADLAETEFHRAILHKANFRGAYLKRSTFVAADLTAADFRHAIIEETDFTGSILECVKMPNLLLKTCALDGARFTGADLRRCNMEGLAASGVDFSRAKLKDALLTGSILKACKFHKSDLRFCGLADIDWEGADLRGADLRRSTFHMGSTRSGLVGSVIPCEGSRTGFYTDDFHDRNFKNPEEIRRANLCKADLRGAKLEFVDFYLVDLRGARYSKKQREWFARCGAILE